ncbi:hypothetical protein ACHAW5_010224 [Stephanodiscus triporus]|uniref:Amino acid transporter transmembrane domain-containing protein n=1 Tax=Stephanodiscus triporus TaxID=2934178 RepID=A0ABD3NNL7_9STRA
MMYYYMRPPRSLIFTHPSIENHHPITPSRLRPDEKTIPNKRNETKRNETKRNKTKQNKTKQNKTKQNKTKKNKTKQNKKKKPSPRSATRPRYIPPSSSSRSSAVSPPTASPSSDACAPTPAHVPIETRGRSPSGTIRLGYRRSSRRAFWVMSYSMILADTVRGLLMGLDITRSIEDGRRCWGIARATALSAAVRGEEFEWTRALLPLVGVAGNVPHGALRMAAGSLPRATRTRSRADRDGREDERKMMVAAIATRDVRPPTCRRISVRRSGTSAHTTERSAPTFHPRSASLSTAYPATQRSEFDVELKNNTLRRYNAVVASSFGISVLLFRVDRVARIPDACSGLILLSNYSGKDTLMGLSRLAVAVSIVFSFPLVFAGARDGWLDLLKVPVDDRTDAVLTTTTVAVLSGITLLASRLRELASIMSFSGATMGNALIYVYPALMFRGAVKGMGEKADKGLRREVPFAMFMALLGVAMGGIGAKMALGLL